MSLALAQAQSPANDLNRPIAESDLLKSLDAINTTEAPRAVPVAPPLPTDPVVAAKPPLVIGGIESLRGPAPSVNILMDQPEKTRKDKGPTEITALEATFDNKTHQAVFIHQVDVRDPEFNVTCDKLTAVLRHTPDVPKTEAAKPAPKSGTPAPKNAADAKVAPREKKGGLERAIAEGNVVITQEKIEANGTVSQYMGRARKADYDARTGDIILTGRPMVKQGINLCVATADETVMILNRDRNMKVTGPHRTTISDKGDLK